MRRAVLYDIRKLVLEEAPKPRCPEEGLLVKVQACAVCATDVKIYNYGHQLVQLPRVLGHEIAGIIEEVSAGLRDRFQSGQAVAVCAVVNCGQCLYCQRAAPSMCERLKAFGYHFDGGYQEVMAVPPEAIRCDGVNVLPNDMDFADASLAELLACCINGQRLSAVGLGQSVLILGAGPVGILHAQLARAQGAARIYLADIDPDRLTLAQSICGRVLTGTLKSDDPKRFVKDVNAITNNRGFEQVMICCSAPQAQQVSLECVAKCGCVNLFGGLPKGKSCVTLDTNYIHYKECRLVGTHGSSAEDNRIALDMISRGTIAVRPLITETIDLAQLERALSLDHGDRRRLKTVVVFPEA